MAVWTEAMTSPLSTAMAAKPRMRSLFTSTSAFKNPRVSDSVRAQDRFHRDLERAVRDSLGLGSLLTQTYAGEFRIREHAERNLPASRHTVAAGQIAMHNAEIIHAHV